MSGRNSTPRGRGRGRSGVGHNRSTPSPRPSSSQSQDNAPPSSTNTINYTTNKGRGGGRGRSGSVSSSSSASFGHRSPSQRNTPNRSSSRFSAGHLFGSGTGAVLFEKEKDSIWKVGPPPNERFQLKAFLRELTAFVAWKVRTQYQQPISTTPEQGTLIQGEESSSNSYSTDIEAGSQIIEDGSEQDTATSSLSTSAVAKYTTAEDDNLGNDNEDEEGTASSRIEANYSVPDDFQTGLKASYAESEPTALASSLEMLHLGRHTTNKNDVDALDTDISASQNKRGWFPSNEFALQGGLLGPRAIEVEPLQPIRLSIRLERRELTDREMELLADWADSNPTAEICKLWLFQNRIRDEGAAHVARMVTNKMQEVHLSHNMLTLQGALSILNAVPCTTAPSRSPLWLRLEWNRLSLSGLVSALESLHSERGILIDVPEAVKTDAAPPLPRLPPYLAAARETAAAAPPSGPRTAGNALRPLLSRCHVRMPWVSCQFELPEEASVLQAARGLWRSSKDTSDMPLTDPVVKPSSPEEVNLAINSKPSKIPKSSRAEQSFGPSPLPSPPDPVASSRHDPSCPPSQGPLIIIPDTSALLPMIQVDPKMSIPTPFTLELLISLAEHGLFGRSLPALEQIFIVIPDSVAKQLDSLKDDTRARAAAKWFMGRGLDACGPAGRNFLSVLGSHEGEGLVLDRAAEVAGSRSPDLVEAKGQATDARIVEVALFFQNEILKSTFNGRNGSNGDQHPLPVLLLSGDHGQINLAKAHGLPAVRMPELKRLLHSINIDKFTSQKKPLTASLFRSLLHDEAVTGLGVVVAKSLQTSFDEAVATVNSLLTMLCSQQQGIERIKFLAAEYIANIEDMQSQPEDLGSGGGGVATVRSIHQELQSLLLPPSALREVEVQLMQWDELVGHQSCSRILEWAANDSL